MILDNSVAKDFWRQYFARRADDDYATLVDPSDEPDTLRLRTALAEAGWSAAEIERHERDYDERLALAPTTSPGVAPAVEAMFDQLCDEVEGAMARLGMASHARVARGIEPRSGPLAAKINVVMTDESVVTVGAFLFRYSGLIARAFTRTLHLNPFYWETDSFDVSGGRKLLRANPWLLLYWLRAYVSFVVTGTPIMSQFVPTRKHEVVVFAQAVHAMEIFAVAHEYGHHHLAHGRNIESDPRKEEFEADQFALRIGSEVACPPSELPDPYVASGAGGVLLLLSLETLRAVEGVIIGHPAGVSDTHPPARERIARFDSVGIMEPELFRALRSFRLAADRILTCVQLEVLEMIGEVPPEAMKRWRDTSRFKGST